jgi:uncharacterized protein
MKSIFIGSNGIRAGWRIAIFIAIFLAIFFVIGEAMHLAHRNFASPKGVITPTSSLVELVSFVVLVAAAYIMSWIERRPFAAYGLPWRGFLQRKLWGGALFGFFAISVSLFGIFALHGFEITGVSTSGSALLVSALLWTPTFLLVGLAEEFLFRGYLQYTLASGLGSRGFLWAALILSLAFGAVHTHNSGESPLGIVQVVVFGLGACLMLRQTGSLWLPVGFHAGADWAESFFYGVPDSGIQTWHPFLTTQAQGPAWLTGGATGPEGSAITLCVLIACYAAVLWRFPRAAIAAETKTA